MNFNDYQKTAINEIEGNVCVIATAGSGKTSVLIERIRHMVADNSINPKNILAVSFSKKACENLICRFSNYADIGLLDVEVKTFHALALSVVNEFHQGSFKVWNNKYEKEKLLFNICNNLELCKSQDDLPIAELSMFINTQKINMRNPNDKLIFYNNIPYSKTDMETIFKEYEKQKKDLGHIELDDLINEACNIFKNKPDILEKFTDKYKYISVDEYQDISYNQNCFLKYLATGNLFVVGDSLQAIYSFRGGDCKYLLNFNKDWDNAKIINLPVNYRCSKDIVETSNKLAECVPDSKNKFYKPAIADHNNYKKPILKRFDKIEDECNYIVDIIQEGVKNKECQYSDYAILTRTNAQLQIIQTRLAKKNIGFNIIDSLSFFELPEIKLFISYLRLSVNVNDNSAFEYCYNKPNRWLSKAFLSEVSMLAKGKSLYMAMFNIDRRNWKFKKGIDELYSIVNNLQHKKNSTVSRHISYIREILNVDAFVIKESSKLSTYSPEAITEKTENIDMLVEICKEYNTIQEFLNHVDDVIKASQENLNESNTVKLMTIHKSKGLEFPVVFISGCSDGLLPHKKSKDIDDEKRLFYVGITRAEKELYLTSSKNYNGKNYFLSPFIDDIKENINYILKEND